MRGDNDLLNITYIYYKVLFRHRHRIKNLVTILLKMWLKIVRVRQHNISWKVQPRSNDWISWHRTLKLLDMEITERIDKILCFQWLRTNIIFRLGLSLKCCQLMSPWSEISIIESSLVFEHFELTNIILQIWTRKHRRIIKKSVIKDSESLTRAQQSLRVLLWRLCC